MKSAVFFFVTVLFLRLQVLIYSSTYASPNNDDYRSKMVDHITNTTELSITKAGLRFDTMKQTYALLISNNNNNRSSNVKINNTNAIDPLIFGLADISSRSQNKRQSRENNRTETLRPGSLKKFISDHLKKNKKSEENAT